MNSSDIYFKKTIPYYYRGNNLTFRVSQVLFSSQQVDHGTQRLLRTFVSEKIDSYTKVLDLGCGYGPIGIALKSFQPTSVLHMVDRDALAVEYSKQNAELNNFKDVKVYGSLGYDDISDTDFDFIVSNIPAKVGEKALSHMLQDARFYLRTGGLVAVVVIDAIAEYVEKILTTDPGITIIFRKAWPGHVVFHYRFTDAFPSQQKPTKDAFDSGVFDREKKVFSIKNINFSMQTTYGLSEFDTLGYDTELLLDRLRTIQNRSFNRVIIFHPNQGHIPVVVSLYTNTKDIILIDRDLQALRVSKRNLIQNGYSEKNITLLHEVGIDPGNQVKVDCIIGMLAEKDDSKVHAFFIKQASQQLISKGILLLSSGSTAITRVEDVIRSEKCFDIVERKRSKGKSSILLKRK